MNKQTIYFNNNKKTRNVTFCSVAIYFQGFLFLKTLIVTRGQFSLRGKKTLAGSHFGCGVIFSFEKKKCPLEKNSRDLINYSIFFQGSSTFFCDIVFFLRKDFPTPRKHFHPARTFLPRKDCKPRGCFFTPQTFFIC